MGLCFVFGSMIFSLIAAIPCSAQTAADDSFTFIHANLIDGISNAPTMDATVVVMNGHIQSIARGPALSGSGKVYRSYGALAASRIRGRACTRR